MLRVHRAKIWVIRVGFTLTLLGLNGYLTNVLAGADDFGTSIDSTMYKLAAEHNDASAQYLVGRNYLTGKSVSKNIPEAVAWLEKAAKQNHKRALYTLGRIYFFGQGVKPDKTTGMAYIGKAGEAGLDEAQLFLGKYYLGENGGNVSLTDAKKWLQSAAEFSNPRAQLALGTVLLQDDDKGNDKQAKEWLAQASEAGEYEAAQVLAQLRREGDGSLKQAKNDQQAPSANDTQPTAPANATSTSTKSKSPRSTGTAAEVAGDAPSIASRKPAAQVSVQTNVGDTAPPPQKPATKITADLTAKEQYSLGMDYINADKGLAKDLAKGLELILSAAKRDFPEAQYNYGMMLRDGTGVAQDNTEALKWLKLAADKGLQSAKREFDALKLKTMLAHEQSDSGKPASQFSMGLRFLNGDGVEKDLEVAAKWILKAAKQKHHEAEAKIGEMYMDGIGVDVDLRTAKHWLSKAAAAGVLTAGQTLEDIKAFEQSSALEAPPQATVEEALKKSALVNVPEQQVTNKAVDSSSKTETTQKPVIVPKRPEVVLVKLPESVASAPNKPDSAQAAIKPVVSNEKINIPGVSESNSGVDGVDADLQATLSSTDAASPIYDLLKEASAGNPDSQYELGRKYLDGKDIPKDIKNGVKWIRLAANNNILAAQLHLGALYLEGDKIDQDSKLAFDWYLRAASSGDPVAELALGDLYKKGLGVDRNNDEAIRWYRLAANKGNKEARKRLGGCKVC